MSNEEKAAMSKKLHFQATINAPKQKVWDTMLGEESYKQWTAVFSPDSASSGFGYRGKWETGSKMYFTALNDKGQEEGMVSHIAEARPPEFLSIKHEGMMIAGVEQTDPQTTAEWGDALENYTFSEEGGVTTLKVDMDSADEYAGMFSNQWPEALAKLKVLCEN